MKSISLISKRDDLLLSAFRRYYEETHCWLGMKHFPFVRYTRNHVVAAPTSVDFDCLSEFSMDSDFKAGDVMRSGSRALMLEDELKFMDPTRIRVASVRELRLLGVADQNTQYPRYLLLFQRGDAVLPAYQERLQIAAPELLSSLSGIAHASLDLCVPRAGVEFPYDALLWLTLQEGHDAALSQLGDLPGLVALVAVATYATPTVTLRENFKAYLP